MSLPTNRVRGDIVDPVDINNIAERVNNLAGDAPIFTTQQGAVEYEAAHPGRMALWFDSGYEEPTLYTTSFDVDAGNLYVTTLSGIPWVDSLRGAFGVAAGTAQMLATGGYATHGASIGAGAGINVGEVNLDVIVEYDLTADARATCQARAFGRGNPQYQPPGGRSEMPCQATVRRDGQVLFEPWIDPADGLYRGRVMATGAPQVGTIRLLVAGSLASVWLNGTQVGDSQVLTGPQLAGTTAGFGVYHGGRVTSFEVAAG